VSLDRIIGAKKMKKKKNKAGSMHENTQAKYPELTTTETASLFKGRISRNEFAWNFFIFIIVCILAFIISGASDLGLFYIVISLIIIGTNSLIVQRLHDLGRPAFHYSLFLIPIYNIIFIYDLCRKDGQVGLNKYGNDPLKKGQKQYNKKR